MPVYKGSTEITGGNLHKGSTEIEDGYKGTSPFYTNGIVTDNLYTYVSMIDTTSNANFVAGTSSLPTTWVDISGNSRDWTVNTLGNAFITDLTNFYWTVNSTTCISPTMNAGDEQTLEMWLNFGGVKSSAPAVGLQGQSYPTYETQYINPTTGEATFITQDAWPTNPATGTSTDIFPYTMPTGGWLQVVFTVSKASAEKKLFVNGAQQASTISFDAARWNSYSSTSQLSYMVTADYGIIRIYSDVLTDAEVLRNYNANKASYGLP